ncbi:hypothetical protein L1049_023547 [Liquidambar formosana]|uniref:Calmodulin-lysine N-methyltransferase n=1 Tax=Liquidambar formosana TaxID=63359 RepID=A0AAP0RTJ2_LIQFO
METTTPKASSLRWAILRQALLRRRHPQSDDQSQAGVKRISRKTREGFNLIPCHLGEDDDDAGSSSKIKQFDNARDVCVCYTLPIEGAPKLYSIQRVDNHADLSDFEICNRYDIDNTGLVCHWPSEDVLAYFCLSHADMFRLSKRVIELGSGYGLAGLVIAAITKALEVVISDGNPQVVDYIQRNIEVNTGAFGGTKVKPMILHWNQEEILSVANTFDVIVASDCPRRGDSLDKFLEEVNGSGLHFSITENYDPEIWKRHQRFKNGDDSWPNYEQDHCYPLLLASVLAFSLTSEGAASCSDQSDELAFARVLTY